MTTTQQLITVGMVVFGTVLTRFLPFILFPTGKKTPAYIRYLGNFLPGAVFGMLVIYSIKDTKFLSANYGIPEILAIVFTAILHLYKRNMMLSIAGGTSFYMLLVQIVFG